MLMDVVPGQVLGRYELLMPVARGGMAMVWAARLKGSRGFQKLVAIKTMLPAMIDDPNFEKMFLDEASLASEIRHPHVIEILDLGEQDNVLYLVMEWVDGEPLNVLMNHAAKQGGVPLRIALSLVAQACRGLHAAHELRDEQGSLVGLVHRDVTPHNILVTYDGVVKIVDFGVAKATSRIAAETEAGQLKGKIAYMSPEQLRGEPIDRRTDVFAMGIVLYMLLTGVHPFKGEDEARTIQNITSPEPVRSIRKYLPGLHAALDGAVAQALAKDAAKRFPSANDLLKALTRVMQPSTDEEVAEYVRALLQNRLEKRRRAVRAALEIADEREEGTEKGTALSMEFRQDQDEVATVAHRMLSAAQELETELDSAPSFERNVEDVFGAAHTESNTGQHSRLRNSAILGGALVGVLGAAAVAAFTLVGGEKSGESSHSMAPLSPMDPQPLQSAVASQSNSEKNAESRAALEPASDDHEPEPAMDQVSGESEPEQASKEASPPNPRGRSQNAQGTRTQQGAQSDEPPPAPSSQPFVTPIRDPGF